MEETTTPPPSSYIPFDIIPETILYRLPVKSLLRFRCVCKSWNSLISKDTNFATKHLRHSPKHQHLVTTSWKFEKELTIMSCPFDPHNLHSTLTSEPTKLDYSPSTPEFYHGLVASCDGLLCFAIDQCLAVIYNPSIRKLKNLPHIIFPPGPASTKYAFGYDPFIHNYKVIAVSYVGARYLVHGYTLGNDSWERIKDFPPMFHLKSSEIHGLFVCGTVNWLTYRCSNLSTIIVSLHLGKESYQEIPPPDYGNRYILNLDVIRNCLCLCSQETSESFIDVWLMKEYGNKESWIKFIRVPCFSNLCTHPNSTKIVYVSDNDNHGLFVFKNDWNTEWIVYDIKNDIIKNSKIEDNDLSIEKSDIYVESLISP